MHGRVRACTCACVNVRADVCETWSCAAVWGDATIRRYRIPCKTVCKRVLFQMARGWVWDRA